MFSQAGKTDTEEPVDLWWTDIEVRRQPDPPLPGSRNKPTLLQLPHHQMGVRAFLAEAHDSRAALRRPDAQRVVPTVDKPIPKLVAQCLHGGCDVLDAYFQQK